MNPRSDRRPPSRGGRGEGRPGPGARFSPRGPSRWRRPEGPGGPGRRADGAAPAARDGERPEGWGPRPEGRGPRFEGRGGPRFEGRGGSRYEPRGAARFEPRGGASRPERRGDRPWGGPPAGDSRFPDRRTPDRRPLDRRGPERRGPDRRPPFGGDGPRPERRPFRRDERPPVAPVIAVEVGEADTHGPAPAADLVWGRHAALAALESGRPVHRIWCTPEMRFSPRFLQLLREAKAGGVLVEEVTWARLGQITGGAVHQGIVLQTAAAETLDLPTLIEGCRGLEEPPLLMAVDGITDPQNLGAIVRSAEALGAHGLVLPQRRSAGLTGSVAKVAAGALEHLPVARVVNLNRSLDALKQEGYRVVGLAGEGTVSLEEADLSGPLVVVTGSEAEGLSMLTRRNCDQLVRIPLRGATPSLNASVATALLLYEIARRGWMRGLRGAAPAPPLVRPSLPQAAPVSQEPEVLAEPEAMPEPDAMPEPQPETVEAPPAAVELEPQSEPVGDGFHVDIQL